MPALKPDLLEKLNQQIANELHASHLYLAMSAHFEAADLPGMAKWMRIQAEEERAHAMRFYGHILERGGRVRLKAIREPTESYESPAAIFQDALDHEREVTQQIYDLYSAAQAAKDYALQVFLNFFITEQVEEERLAETVLEKVKRLGNEPTGLELLDRELGGRAGEKE